MRSWLLAISRNAAIDHVRVRRARPLDPEAVTALLADHHSDGGVPDDASIAAVEAAQVRQALARIPDGQRRAMLLATVGGRTAAEVGDIEGIPVVTAKTRIRTALSRMRATLEVDARRG